MRKNSLAFFLDLLQSVQAQNAVNGTIIYKKVKNPVQFHQWDSQRLQVVEHSYLRGWYR